MPSSDPYTPVKISDRDTNGKDFQGFLTDYTLNTFLYSALTAAAPLNITIPIEKYFHTTITTDMIGNAIP